MDINIYIYVCVCLRNSYVVMKEKYICVRKKKKKKQTKSVTKRYTKNIFQFFYIYTYKSNLLYIKKKNIHQSKIML